MSGGLVLEDVADTMRGSCAVRQPPREERAAQTAFLVQRNTADRHIDAGVAARGFERTIRQARDSGTNHADTVRVGAPARFGFPLQSASRRA